MNRTGKIQIKNIYKEIIEEVKRIWNSFRNVKVIQKVIGTISLFPFVSVIYLYSYLAIANICNKTLFPNIKAISIKPNDLISEIIYLLIIFSMVVLPIIISNQKFLQDNKSEIINKNRGNNYLSMVFKWIAIILLLVIITSIIMSMIKVKGVHLSFFVVIGMLACMYIYYWILCSNENISDNRLKIYNSLKNFFGIYIVYGTFFYPIISLSKNNGKINSITFILICAQMIYVSYQAYKSKSYNTENNNETNNLLITPKLFISGILIPLALALIEKLLGIK